MLSNEQKKSFSSVQKLCFSLAKSAGWHDINREDGTMIALIHSEISEALEGFRKNLMDKHITHRQASEVELADAIIRILDFSEKKGYDMAGAISEKLKYNQHREDHKKENRSKEGGKKF